VQGAVLAILAALPDDALARKIDGRPLQVHLYAALRREQRAAVASTPTTRSEARLILAFARSAFAELEALLAGRQVIDTARDGGWSLRDLLRHAIAVELRYREQVLWSADRRDADPVAIPADRLPCDRLAPPVPEFAGALAGDTATVLELLARARAGTDERLADLAVTALDRPSLWGSAQVDVRERIHQIGAHLVEVIVQSEKMLGERESEARRIVRRIAAVRGLHLGSSTPAQVERLDAQLAQLGRAVTSG
jgi:hypothetical protein